MNKRMMATAVLIVLVISLTGMIVWLFQGEDKKQKQPQHSSSAAEEKHGLDSIPLLVETPLPPSTGSRQATETTAGIRSPEEPVPAVETGAAKKTAAPSMPGSSLGPLARLKEEFGTEPFPDYDELGPQARERVARVSRRQNIGLNVDIYFPVSNDFETGFGAGLVYDFELTESILLDLSIEVFSIQNSQDEEITALIPMVRGDVLYFWSSFFAGGGGGVGMSMTENQDNTSFVFAEVKVGYAFDLINRVSVRYFVPLNTDERIATIACGYEILF